MGSINTSRGRISRIIKNIIKLIVIIGIIGLLLYGYARYIEPELLVIKEENIYIENLNLSKPLRLVQCSDLHLGEDYDMEHLKRVVDKMNALDADIIVFTGDLVDDNRTFKEIEDTKALLSLLEAEYGKYAIMGNHDYGWKGPSMYHKIIKDTGFKLLINENVSIKIDQENSINIIGIDDIIFGEPNIQKAMKGVSEKACNILLCHEPDVADEFQGYPIDLQLSGHSHGGQVSFPLIGAPFTNAYGSKYIRGMYQMPHNARMQLYVNVGIGTSQVRYRFGCIPELTVFNLS